MKVRSKLTETTHVVLLVDADDSDSAIDIAIDLFESGNMNDAVWEMVNQDWEVIE